MSDAAVSVRGLGKRYRIVHERQRYARLTETLWEALRHPLRRGPAPEEFWALRDVSFDVAHGDVVGIIGRNGAGKSTLLKILSRITEPTEGEAVLRGRVSSLLEVGTGFHPELTGRENIYLSGSILGMRRAEIRRRFDEIVAFAEVERFLDTPVKRYSSGMQVRLGFAVAAHLEPDVLVVDEVLAVGDATFQKKSLAKMESVSTSGRTVLFVSHNMAAVESLCGRAVLLHHGQVAAAGPTDEVVEAYVAAAEDARKVPVADRPDRKGGGPVRVTSISAHLRTGAEGTIVIGYESNQPVREAQISLGLFTLRGEGAAFLANSLTGDRLTDLPVSGSVTCVLGHNPLLPGRYTLNVHVIANGQLSDWIVEAAAIEVEDGDAYGTGRLPPPGYGSTALPHRWRVDA